MTEKEVQDKSIIGELQTRMAELELRVVSLEARFETPTPPGYQPERGGDDPNDIPIHCG